MPDIDPGKGCLQGIVENLAHIGRLAKDAACHGYRKQVRWSSFYQRMGSKAAHDGGREDSQFGSSVGQKLTGNGIALLGRAQNDGKQAREVGRRSRVGVLHQVVDRGEFPGLENHGGEHGFESLIARMEYSGDGLAPDPVAGAFIRDGEPPASGTRGATDGIASVNQGTGAGNRDHAGARPKSCFEGNYVVAGNLEVGQTDLWHQLGENAANLRGDFGYGSAGNADTNGVDLIGSNPGSRTCLVNDRVQSFSCLRLAQANYVAAARRCRSKWPGFVAEKAAGFGAAAVDSEIVGHRVSSNTGLS